MDTKAILVLILALLIGGGGGWLLRGVADREARGTENVASERSSARRPLPERSPGTGWNNGGQSAGQGAGRQHTRQEDEERILVDADAVAALLKTEVPTLEHRTQLVSADEPLARFLNINAEDVAALNRVWQEIRPKLRDLRTEHVSYQEREGDGMWVGVSPFPDEGEVLRVELLLSTTSRLGEARGKVFLDAMKAHRAFGNWGKTVSGDFTIGLWEQDDGSNVYEITEQARSDGSPGRKWRTSRVPAHLKDLADAVGIPVHP